MARSMLNRRERRLASAGAVRQMRFGAVVNRYPALTIMSADEIESIHHASLRLLLETGIEILHEESRSLLEVAGAEVDGNNRVRFDMRTGSPAFGTPEYAKAQIASGQLARRYNAPFRSSNVTASNTVDVQAAYEGGMSLWSTILGGVSLIEHAAGWLEGGLTASFEKLILDAEMLQMMRSFLSPIAVDDDNLAVEAISEVGPGGHFFGTGHTLARFENAFYEPMLSDWRNFENWSESGARSGTDRANAIWKDLLRTYEQPPLDPAVDEALEAYVAKRKEEIAPTSSRRCP